jgi:uncharacterized membrane protein YraQ (UPF0718 family)
MLLGSAISVFGKEKIHSLFAALRGKKLGVLGLIPASLIGIASPCAYTARFPLPPLFLNRAWRRIGLPPL